MRALPLTPEQHGCILATHDPPALQVQATATSGGGVLQKLARVFKEKAQQDLSRIVKGTSKTREKLGVRD